jgi:hypothetical protein
MNGAEVLIPLTIFGGGFAMIFGIAYLKTRENLAMVEKGMNPKQKHNRPAPFKSLKLGLLLLGAGIGLLIAFLIDFNMLRSFANGNYYRNDDGIPFLYFSLIAIGGGLGLITSYAIERKYLLDRKEETQL